MCAGSIPLPSHTVGLSMWLYFAKDYSSSVIIEPNKDSHLHVALCYKGNKIREFKVINDIFIFRLLVLHPPPPALYMSNILKYHEEAQHNEQHSKSEFYCFDYIWETHIKATNEILPQPENWSYMIYVNQKHLTIFKNIQVFKCKFINSL